MIEYIKGHIDALTPAVAIIETPGGVAYQLNISLNTYSALEGKTEARLLVHEAIREDAWVMYGFADESERALFRLLIGVSGVGANTARMLLSSLAVPQLEQVISSGDSKQLKVVKGVGTKTAERIIVDLKDKIKVDDNTLSLQSPDNNDRLEEALAALVMLGFQRQASLKVLDKLFQANPSITVEAAIKRSLTML